eukprot:RCo055291
MDKGLDSGRGPGQRRASAVAADPCVVRRRGSAVAPAPDPCFVADVVEPEPGISAAMGATCVADRSSRMGKVPEKTAAELVEDAAPVSFPSPPTTAMEAPPSPTPGKGESWPSPTLSASSSSSASSPGALPGGGWVPPVFEKPEEEREWLKAALRGNYLFQDLHDAELEQVVDAMRKHSYSTGDTLCHEGAPYTEGDSFQIILEGQCVMSRQNAPESRTHVTTAGCLREEELLYKQACPATVVAETEVLTYALDRRTYRRLLAWS